MWWKVENEKGAVSKDVREWNACLKHIKVT